MSCRRNAERAAQQIGPKTGISRTTGRSADAAQASFFALAGQGNEQAGQTANEMPKAGHILLSDRFSPDELDQMSIQFRLGAAAARRQIAELGDKATGRTASRDPRPLDWARLDRRQYEFLAAGLKAGRKEGRLDISSLKEADRLELWAFARFEADRAHRNIDHLTAGLSHLRGETAVYLVDRHRLAARFYSHLAGQLEAMLPPETLVREDW